jgi:hypothetical protein
VSSSPNTPRLLKGAILGVDVYNPLASVVIFQYNPDTLTRTLKPRNAPAGSTDNGPCGEVQRVTSAPVETIHVSIEIDATDQLERRDRDARKVGIYPQLSALEMLLYPKSLQVIANAVLMAVGTIEVLPTLPTLTLFVWGAKRVLPVALAEFTITEQAFDERLNPIRARVDLGMRVLTYSDLPITHPGYHLFLVHQVFKETMATVGSLNTLADVVSGKLSPSSGL